MQGQRLIDSLFFSKVVLKKMMGWDGTLFYQGLGPGPITIGRVLEKKKFEKEYVIITNESISIMLTRSSLVTILNSTLAAIRAKNDKCLVEPAKYNSLRCFDDHCRLHAAIYVSEISNSMNDGMGSTANR